MPVSGLVITLSEDEDRAAEAVARLREDPRLTVGVRNGRKLAATSETASPSEDPELLRTLESDPGIVAANVVFIGFDEEGEGTPVPAPPTEAKHS